MLSHSVDIVRGLTSPYTSAVTHIVSISMDLKVPLHLQTTYPGIALLEVSLYLTEDPIAGRQAVTVCYSGSQSVVFWRKWTTESNNLLGLCFFTDYRSRMRRNCRRRRVPPCSVEIVSWSFRRELLVKEVIRWAQSSRGQDCSDVFYVESGLPICYNSWCGNFPPIQAIILYAVSG